jgi:hypothetical protein
MRLRLSKIHERSVPKKRGLSRRHSLGNLVATARRTGNSGGRPVIDHLPYLEGIIGQDCFSQRKRYLLLLWRRRCGRAWLADRPECGCALSLPLQLTGPAGLTRTGGDLAPAGFTHSPGRGFRLTRAGCWDWNRWVTWNTLTQPGSLLAGASSLRRRSARVRRRVGRN